MAIGEYLTAQEAAKKLRVSLSRIYQFANEGRLPFERVGQQRFFHREHVANFAKSPRKTGRPKNCKKGN